MSDAISDASFVNKDSTKKRKSYQTLIREAINFFVTFNKERLLLASSKNVICEN